MAASVPLPQQREAPSGWVGSLPWDLCFMFSALWGSLLCGMLSLQVGLGAAAAMLFTANALVSVCHSFSTTYMVVASPLLRDARRRDRRKYTWTPLAIALGSIALGFAMGATGSFPERFPLDSGQALWAFYLALFWVGHFWHFGNQDFGVLSIYRLKSGQSGLRDRHVDKAYAATMMFAIQPLVYLKSVGGSPWSEAVYSFLPISRGFVHDAATLGLGVAVVFAVGVIVLELRKPNRSIPKLLYYLVMLAHPAVLYFVHWRLGFFYMISYFWSHWFIAIGLVGRINTHYYQGRGSSLPRALLFHLGTFGSFAAVGLAFHLVFGRYNVFSGGDYKELLSAVWPEWQGLIGLLLGVFLAEQLVHYYCDRCLFRFRDPEVRQAVAPLI